MQKYKYIVLGGGMTADSAVKGIREVDSEGTIGLFSRELNPPYDRPPLTKGLWKGDDAAGIWRNTQKLNIDLHLGTTIASVDLANKRVTDDHGEEYGFEKLLFATGVSPRKLEDGDGALYYRTFDDYERLRALTQTSEKFAVIGNGFIGSELAAALAMNGKQVTLIARGHSIGENLFPSDLSRFLDGYYESKGVKVMGGALFISCEPMGKGYEVRMNWSDGGSSEYVDAVIVGIGTTPNVELAQAAGLTVDNGIRVNSHLQTSHPDVYAAGDVASFHDPVLDEWRRVEHEDNANTMGAFAGRAMAGQAGEYTHSPFFYSDLFDLGYEAVGIIDSRLETFSDWKEPFREGVVYYLRDGRVRGVLLWNTWDQVENARQLIAEPGPFGPDNLKGRLPR